MGQRINKDLRNSDIVLFCTKICALKFSYKIKLLPMKYFSVWVHLNVFHHFYKGKQLIILSSITFILDSSSLLAVDSSSFIYLPSQDETYEIWYINMKTVLGLSPVVQSTGSLI